MYVPTFVYVGLEVKLYVPLAVPYFMVVPDGLLTLTLIPLALPLYVLDTPFAV